jgi:hypothetical protein
MLVQVQHAIVIGLPSIVVSDETEQNDRGILQARSEECV